MAGATDLIPYRSQVVNFLGSCTIHYSTLALVINQSLFNNGYDIDETDIYSWKYYKNIVGEYHETDTVMKIISLDTLTEVDFTKDMLKQHPKTAAAYRVGNTEYNALCDKYPTQTDLIRSIVHPAPSIDFVYNSRDFTLVQYGSGYLEPYEEMTVVLDINTFLDVLHSRWYMANLSHELYFYAVFWGMIWNALIISVLTTRIKNIHTAYAHDQHIWDYLSSMGLGDYRDILSRRQVMFLYRNIRYIIENRGKESNLILLANNLLDEIGIALTSRFIRQQTESGTDECRWIPEFLSEAVPTKYASSISLTPTQTTGELISRLSSMGLEEHLTITEIDTTERRMGYTNENQLATKILEFHPVPKDRKYSDLLNVFIMDTLFTMINDDRYIVDVEFTDAQTGIEIKLTAKNALILLFMCMYKRVGDTPTTIPTKYSPTAPFKYDIDVAYLPNRYLYESHWYPISQLFSVSEFVDGIYFPPLPIIEPENFSELVADLFSVRVKQIVKSRSTTDHVTALAIKEVFRQITIQDTIEMQLSNHNTYADWFNEFPEIYQLSTIYDSSDNSKILYDNLMGTILKILVPTTTSLYQYMDTVASEKFYSKLKQLFIQLCSYNVLFLDVNRDSQLWIFLNNMTVYTKESITYLGEVSVDLPDVYEHSRLTNMYVDIPDTKMYNSTEMHQSTIDSYDAGTNVDVSNALITEHIEVDDTTEIEPTTFTVNVYQQISTGADYSVEGLD